MDCRALRRNSRHLYQMEQTCKSLQSLPMHMYQGICQMTTRSLPKRSARKPQRRLAGHPGVYCVSRVEAIRVTLLFGLCGSWCIGLPHSVHICCHVLCPRYGFRCHQQPDYRTRQVGCSINSPTCAKHLQICAYRSYHTAGSR